MYEMLMQYVMPELFVLIPVLYALGVLIKKSDISNKYIPLYLGMLSVVLCTIYVFSATDVYTVKEGLAAMFVSITQGILCASISVYANQLVKQANKDE